MKVCFPVEKNEMLESNVYSHFGSASAFLIYDTEKSDLKAIDNSDQHHAHGACQPLKALNGAHVDVVIVGGIGAGAINKLNAMGIKVFRSKDGSVKHNIEMFNDAALSEITAENACTHHGH